MHSPRVAWLLLCVLGAFGIGLLALQERGVVSLTPPCVFHKLTGLYCPGCGSTRASQALIGGDVAHAFSMNPFFVVCVPLLAYYFARSAWTGIVRNERYSTGILAARIIKALAVLMLVFGVFRNLPWPVFAWMAPG